MTLAPGTRLGSYEIVAPLGAGGMGEVYRALDTRLDRAVAIKILPEEFSSDPVPRQRFEREAKTISSLNHPHICILHDIGHHQGIAYLVLEYVEGETLDKRLQRGPLPPDQTLRYAIEIADALDKAHRTGVIHRDLKPSNIMLTKSGAKLLDFGLAKLHAQPPPLADAFDEMTTVDDSKLTGEDMLVGTFQYMAPEQLEGREADARTDIFAFGAVLYEMATGRPAFQGKTKASLIAAILSFEPPPITQLQPAVPPTLERVVRLCLAKEPDERWQAAHDVKLELESVAQSAAKSPERDLAPSRLTRWLIFGAAAALLLSLAALVYVRTPLPEQRESIRAYILPPENASFYFIGGRAGPAVISPDGKRLAFTAVTVDGKHLLWVRSLNSASAQPLAGTEGAAFPFWSPDSRMLGFFAQGALRKVDAGGGPVQTLAGTPLGRGGSWAPDGTIIFAPSLSSAIYRVSSSGGEPTAVTKVEDEKQERSHRWPFFLPDGRHFLFLSRLSGWENKRNSVYVGTLDSPERKEVLKIDSSAIYASPGFLLYLTKDGTLMAQPFDAARLEKRGEAFPIAEQVLENYQVNLGLLSASANGILVYQPARDVATRLLWFDRSGKRTGGLDARAFFSAPELSPDGRRVAVDIFDPSSRATDIWIYELSRSLATRFTFGPGDSTQPVWSPDGKRIAFSCERNGFLNLCVKPASGTGEQQVLSSSAADEAPMSWSPDGRYLAYSRLALPGTTRTDVWIVPLFGDQKPFPFLHSPVEENDARFSPDGKWMAYMSYESGRNEIYITSFPGGTSKWQVSTSGAREPRWRADGKELFYLTSDNALAAVEVRAGASRLELGAARLLFTVRPRGLRGALAASTDGQHFLVNTIEDERLPPLMLVTNWAAPLTK